MKKIFFAAIILINLIMMGMIMNDQDKINSEFILSNCDIIVDTDYLDFLNFHKKNNNIISLIGSIQHYKIPYDRTDFHTIQGFVLLGDPSLKINSYDTHYP